jgi:hypothetical protein
MTPNSAPGAAIPPTSGGSNSSAVTAASVLGAGAPTIGASYVGPSASPRNARYISPELLSASVKNAVQSTISVPTGGIIVPLYSYPGSDWDVVVQAKQAHPSVPIVVIINPSNGPGDSQDQNYVSGVDRLRSAGVIVLGYVHTSYAARSLPSVIADINSYKAWYAVNGIFFDEMSNVPGNEAYYSSLGSYAKSVGLSLTFGNPGASVPASYVGTVDCIVIYESQGLPDASSITTWTMGMGKNNFAVIAYGVNQVDSSSMGSLPSHVAYVYVTDGSLPNPYGVLPGYFVSLVAALDTIAPT